MEKCLSTIWKTMQKKKTALYLRFEKYHNLHFFKKKKILRLIVYQQDIYCPCSANEQV